MLQMALIFIITSKTEILKFHWKKRLLTLENLIKHYLIDHSTSIGENGIYPIQNKT